MLQFVVVSIATLRERVTGTLERLLATPLGRVELLAGYVLAFGCLALAQAVITALFTVAVLNMPITGSPWLLTLATALSGLVGVSLGLFTSVFARTEFQVVQHLPPVVLPQFLLCGLFVPPRLDAHSPALDRPRHAVDPRRRCDPPRRQRCDRRHNPGD